MPTNTARWPMAARHIRNWTFGNNFIHKIIIMSKKGKCDDYLYVYYKKLFDSVREQGIKYIFILYPPPQCLLKLRHIHKYVCRFFAVMQKDACLRFLSYVPYYFQCDGITWCDPYHCTFHAEFCKEMITIWWNNLQNPSSN